MGTSSSEGFGSGATAAGRTIEATTSAVSWPDIIAGAFVAASASLILLALGSRVWDWLLSRLGPTPAHRRRPLR
jgi:hypothetical protein